MQVFLTLICYGTKNIRWFLRSFEGFKTFIDALLRDRTQRQNFYSKQMPKKKVCFTSMLLTNSTCSTSKNVVKTS